MFPAAAAGAHDPAPFDPHTGPMAAVMTAGPEPNRPPEPPDPPPDGGLAAAATRLSRHMAEALGQCRRLGHREPRVSLTRPVTLAEAVRRLLAEAGLDAAVAPAGLPGHLVVTLRG